MKSFFTTFVRYNTWANSKLYHAVSKLDEADFHKDMQAFFGSVCGTLNHLLVVDQRWLNRLQQTGQNEVPLDTCLHHTFADLRAARVAQDAALEAYVLGLSDADVAADAVYKNSTGQEFRQPRQEILHHLFNHQTHHRGQVHNLLSQLHHNPPELDLLYYFRAQNKG